MAGTGPAAAGPPTHRSALAARLPGFPWDRLDPYRDRAAAAGGSGEAGPSGLVDLSVGTPVDPCPQVVREALAAAADAPGYPSAHGSPALRAAIVGYLGSRFGVTGLDEAAVLACIGSKELVAWLPALLGLGADDAVAVPPLAYPTYEIGAHLAGTTPVRADPAQLVSGSTPPGSALPRLVWVNSPANPSGQVLDVATLRDLVGWARRRGVVVASDECYAEFGWDCEPVSILHPQISGGSPEGLLALHSLSKRSNMAGYRAAFLAGDPALVAELVGIRRHAGMMTPTPVQAAMIAALGDRDHVVGQRVRYGERRAALRGALHRAGFTVEHSEAGLYLWATRGDGCWDAVGWLAERGILVAPGDFYGEAGSAHVRVALTAPDERVAAAVTRLAG